MKRYPIFLDFDYRKLVGHVEVLDDADAVAWDETVMSAMVQDPGGLVGFGVAAVERGRLCPDGGSCHHGCGARECYRVQACGPLSDVYPGDDWPDAVKRAFG